MTRPPAVPAPAAVRPRFFGWWSDGTPDAKRALIAAALGWMLDAFDVMLYALLLTSIIADLGISRQTAGAIGSVTLLAAAAGGLFFGVVADRYGRTRALMASVLIYSVFTAACGFATTALQLAVFRILLGIGMGGEWASGAALVSETWPAEHRGKALGLMQSAWAIGYLLAAAVTMIVLPRWGWRVVFFVGVLPAFLTLWVRRHVREPELWLSTRGATRRAQPPRRRVPRRPCRRDRRRHRHERVHALRLVGLQPVAPGLPVDARRVGRHRPVGRRHVVVRDGDAGRDVVRLRHLRVHQRRHWPQARVRHVSGDRRVLIAVYTSLRTPILLLLLGPFVAFFATGYFSGFGAVTAEIYPTDIRATAQGFTYNLGRIASAAAPFTVGTLAQTRGFDVALSTTSVAFVLAAVLWIWIPETKGRELV